MTKKNVGGTITIHCDRCACFLTPHEGYQNPHVDLCGDCYAKDTVDPGEYAYVLRLWWLFDQKHIDLENNPPFWPKKNGRLVHIITLLEMALREKLPNLPCGITCACTNISARQQKCVTMPAATRCIFHRMQESCEKATLLLYWYLRFYTKRGSHPDFWPTLADNDILSPTALVTQALNID